ncbi:hypothetical protein Riv7116_4592 [Rivularia sp. PCC 7116]|uniref:hypothetical protein n=1 Tax=Rivularia sp. PCC 7116 TaxID=373994 RepID=UPI00029ED946|nr:hypothetical protein [Rivularia sp. PCC 7116]AFY57011.1 hypothetical protein Riv7116_4592 [Rivularia sp. PCC 7116]
MENTQSVQQESSEVKESAPISDNNEPESKVNRVKNVAVYLFVHYPWLFLAGLLLMFLGGGAISIYSLGYVDESIKRKGSETTLQAEVIPPKAPVAENSNQNPIPLWMVAAIAFSCASGCLVILRVLNRPKQKQKVKKQVVNRHEIRLAQRRYQVIEARLPKRKTPARASNGARRTPIMAMPPQKPKPKPVVTVLPPEHNFEPNQKGKDSLADMMDIRKQTPLSSMLRK